MANWAADFLTRNPELAGRPIQRHRHALSFALPSGERQSFFVGSPAHYWDATDGWQPLDTALQLIGTEYGAPGLATRLALDGSVRIDGQDYSHRSTRIGLLNPTTKAFSSVKAIPTGNVDGARIVAESGIWQRVLTLTEVGLREEIVIAAKPTGTGAGAGDWLVLETQVNGVTFADGWLSKFSAATMLFPPPQAHDANGDMADCKRYARVVGGKQYIYTGVPVAWLADAAYPVTIDPDFSSATTDGGINGYHATTYATARSTATGYATGSGSVDIGQITFDTSFIVYRAFFSFNTSTIPDGDTVTGVTLTLTCDGGSDETTTDFDVQIVKQNWTTPLNDTTKEANYDGCLAGTADDNIWRNTSGMADNTPYTSGALSAAWINKTGTTYYSLRSSRDYAGTEPTGYERFALNTQNDDTAAYRPILSVTHAASGQPMLTRGRLLSSCTLQGRLVR